MKRRTIFTTQFLAVLIMWLLTGCNSSDDLLFNDIGDTPQNVDVTNMSIDIAENPEVAYKVTLADAQNMLKALKFNEHSEIRPVEKGGDTLLYVVTSDNGWLVIAGDKRVYPIVAESEKGDGSTVFTNENLAAWIDSYADELQATLSNMNKAGLKSLTTTTNSDTKGNQVIGESNLQLWEKISPTKASTSIATRSSGVTYKWAVVSYTYCESETSKILIDHLISTKWHQGDPLNEKLPYDTSAKKQCPTGCVAVALAQILYYSHYSIGKPNGLYHDINVSKSSISKATSDIGFSRSNYVANSDRWNQMPLKGSGSGSSYVGDLMLDIGNRVGMTYAGGGSSASISSSALSYYNLTYSSSAYNYQTVKSNLQNSKPVYVRATGTPQSGGEKKGHAWIIDGLASRTRHYVTRKHFEYTENWMHESEYYDTFDELRTKYHINSEYDIIEEDNGTYTYEYLIMNWGWGGQDDDTFISTGVSDSWTGGNWNFKDDKTIYYDFR